MWHQKDIVQELSAKLDMIHPLVDSELTKYLFVITLVASSSSFLYETTW